MKKYILYFVSFITLLLFIFMPVSASGLCFRLYIKDATEPLCFVYYTTVEDGNFSEEQKIIGNYDAKSHCVTVRFDKKLAHKLTNIRIDFAHSEQLFCIDEISLGSAGAAKKYFAPDAFFDASNFAAMHSIAAMDKVPSRKVVYILTEADDPYLLLNQEMVDTFNRNFSNYRFSRFLVGLFLVAVFISFKSRMFKTKDAFALNKSDEVSNSRSNGEFIIVALFGLILVYLAYPVLWNNTITDLADYRGHLRTIIPQLYGPNTLDGWLASPHCLWHLTTMLFHSVLMIPLETAAVFSGCLYTLLGYYVTYYIIKRVLDVRKIAYASALPVILAFGLCVVQGIFGNWMLVEDHYLGIFSINAIHSPTQTCVRAFALLAFALVYDILEKNSREDYRSLFFEGNEGCRKHYICLAFVLFVSATAKPTFAQMFIPTVGVYMLVFWIYKLVCDKQAAKKYFRECLSMLCCALPALIYIFASYFGFYLFGAGTDENGGLVITKLGEVWGYFTDNIYLGILLGMAFPLYVVVIDSYYFLTDTMGRLSVIGYIVGLLEALFFGEGGARLLHGNFIWPMMSGMLLLWTTATIRLTVLELSTENKSKKQSFLLNFGWCLFCAHLLCGFFTFK